MCQISEMKIYKRCKTPEDGIAVFVVKDGKQLGLCGSCWKKVGEGDYEWGPDSKPIVEEIFSRRAKEEAAATPTEYKPYLKGAGKYKAIQQQEDEEITVEDEVAEAEGKSQMEEDEEKESLEESKLEKTTEKN